MAQAAIGFGISTALGLLGNSLKPINRVYNEIGKVEDLTLPKTGSGFTLARIYGRYKIDSCFIFWAVPKIDRPITTTETSGSKKTGQTQTTTTTHNYYYTFAVAVCDSDYGNEGVQAVKKVYINGKIWYNEDGSTDGTTANNNFILSENLEIYLGTANQGRSPTIESYEGTNRTPTLPYTCYLVFKEVPESVIGSWPPAISVEIEGKKTNIDQVIKDVCLSSGLIEGYDFYANNAGSDKSIVGGKFKQDGGTYRDFLDEVTERFLLMARFAENSGKKAIEFVPRDYSGLNTFTLTADDLKCREVGSGSDVDPYKENFENTLDLPSEVSVTTVDPNNKFKTITRSVIKQGIGHRNPLSINSTLAMTEGMCDDLAYKKLNQLWIERRTYEDITLLPHWLEQGMLAGDKLILPLESGDNVTIQITELNVGANFLLNIKAKAYDENLFTQVPVRGYTETVTASTTIQLSQTQLIVFESLTNADGTITYVEGVDYTIDLETGIITIISEDITDGDSLVVNYQSGVDTTTVTTTDDDLETPYYPDPELVLLDIYKPKATDPEGIYVAIKSTGDFTDTGIFAREAGGTFQQVSIISSLSTTGVVSGTLPNVSGEDLTSTLTIVLSHGTLDPLSDTDYGNNTEILLIGDEQVCVKNKTLTAPNTYSCTTIKRGLNGTTPVSHTNGTRVIMLKGNNNVQLLQIPSTYIGKTLEAKAVTVGKSLGQVATTYTINFEGKAWECLPVSNVAATKDQAGNIYINWTGSNRGTGLVLPEKYDIVIGSRTLTSTTNNVVYSYTDQITDYGSVQSSINVTIYQVSTEVGQGIPYTITLTPTLSVTESIITGFSPTQGSIGDAITVYGSGFTGSTSAMVGVVSLTSFVVFSDSVITGIIDSGTTTGKVSVTNGSYTVESLTDFVITTSSVTWGDIGGNAGDNPSLEYELLKMFWIKS